MPSFRAICFATLYLISSTHNLQKGNETPRREPEQAEGTEASAPSGQVPEELTRVTRYRAPDPIIDDPSTESVKPYTSVRCAKEAKEVRIDRE